MQEGEDEYAEDQAHDFDEGDMEEYEEMEDGEKENVQNAEFDDGVEMNAYFNPANFGQAQADEERPQSANQPVMSTERPPNISSHPQPVVYNVPGFQFQQQQEEFNQQMAPPRPQTRGKK